jgi:hypothetical protein
MVKICFKKRFRLCHILSLFRVCARTVFLETLKVKFFTLLLLIPFSHLLYPSVVCSELYIECDRLDQRHGTTACPPCEAMGKIEVKQRGKKCLVLDRLEQPKQDKNLMYRHDKTNELTKERPTPFHMNSLSPHLPQFKQSAITKS